MLIAPQTHPLRLFVATPPPPSLRETIASTLAANSIQKPPFLRWLDPHSYHLTLCFLGDTPANHLTEIRRMIKQIVSNYATISVHTGPWGAFPNALRPRVLWLGLTGNGLLLLDSLAQTLKKQLTDQTESDPPFIPHLTVAKIHHNMPITAINLKNFPLLNQPWTIETLHLYQSQQTAKGVQYHILQTFSLGQTNPINLNSHEKNSKNNISYF
ncbi:MAG: RNA 2',3'-cyclic phosphodiesterase [Magnetococcus sp. DMHC-6]